MAVTAIMAIPLIGSIQTTHPLSSVHLSQNARHSLGIHAPHHVRIRLVGIEQEPPPAGLPGPNALLAAILRPSASVSITV